MTLDELEQVWDGLPAPNPRDGISGRRAPGMPANRPVYLGMDGQSRRHLLVPVPDSTTPVVQRETRSLEVVTARFQVGSNPEALYVDLACTDSAQHATFSAVAQDLIRTLRTSSGPIRDSIINALARWRAFWSVKPVGLSREDALGLFGELWFLTRWLAPKVGADAVARWQTVDAARHDFQWPAASIEVKTSATQTSGAPCHRVVSLDQLASPEQGELFLFSLQVCDDALSLNTLHAIVDSLAALLTNEYQAVFDLNDKLAARGYSPADRDAADRPLRVIAERLYRVDDRFPRLTRRSFDPAGLPQGIVGVEYSIDLTACNSWLIATKPTDSAASILT